MKFSKIKIAIAIAMTIFAVGCGQSSYDEDDATTVGGSTNTDSNGDSNRTGGGSWTPTVVITDSNAQPSASYHVKMTGTGSAVDMNGSVLSVVADSILKVSITVGDGLPFQTSGWNIGFNCEKFAVRVGNLTLQAAVKRSGAQTIWNDPCQGMPTTWTGDFSSTLGVGGKTSTIQINTAKYDNCRLAGNPRVGGCGPLTDVYSTHSVDAYVTVYTD